jgi:hypothetical protein
MGLKRVRKLLNNGDRILRECCAGGGRGFREGRGGREVREVEGGAMRWRMGATLLIVAWESCFVNR